MMTSLSNLLQVCIFVVVCTASSCAFTQSTKPVVQFRHLRDDRVSRRRIVSGKAPFLCMTKEQQDEQQPAPSPKSSSELYPVISRISGINWTGSCRYVGADLIPLSKLKLTGGVRYDIINGSSVVLTSFLTFPNGNTRQVRMEGSRQGLSPVITLRSFSDEGDDENNKEEEGPIYMQLTELGTDTILINEVERATGKTILTASLNVVQGLKGSMELVQVSHEVGSIPDTTDDKNKILIEGHQIWRLTGGPVEFDDFDDNKPIIMLP